MKSVHPSQLTNTSYDYSQICQGFSLTDRQIGIIEYLLSLGSNEIATQYKISSDLSISYSSVNSNLKKLVSVNAVIPVSAGKGRVVKYVVNDAVVLSYCKSNFQTQKLLCLIDKTTHSILDSLKDCSVGRLESKAFERLIKISIPQSVIDVLSTTDKVVVSNRLYYVIDGENYTPKQAAVYVAGDSFAKGKKIRNFPAVSTKIMAWKNAITGIMQFNFDFSKVEEIYPEEIECIGAYRSLTSGTKLAFITNKKLVELIREFTPQVLLTKIMYILSRIKTKIRNAYAYLKYCLSEIDKTGECFIETHVTDSGEAFVYPKLFEFYISIKNRRTRTAKELFKLVANKIIGVNGKVADSRLDNLYRYFCNSNVELFSLCKTREGY